MKFFAKKGWGPGEGGGRGPSGPSPKSAHGLGFQGTALYAFGGGDGSDCVS